MTIDKEQLVKLCDKIYQNNIIDKSYYSQYDVKRGLRNQNGTGVLVGLTHIGDVQGYKLEDGIKLPAPGKLFYRGIDVEDIVKSCLEEDRAGYEEVSYLLIFGDLPNKEELESYKRVLGANRELPDNFFNNIILTAPSQDIMNKLARTVLTLYSFDPNPDDTSIENVLIQSIKLVAQFPVLIAYAYQAKSRYYDNKSMHLHYPDPELGTAENLLRLIRPDGKYTKIEAKLLDLAMVLHAEHGGGNNSAFTTHVVSSSGTDTYSTIASAVSSLKGPKHGGANKAVFNMMVDLKANVSDIRNFDEVEEYLIKLLRGEVFDKAGLVYGMGHAVYTISDPRAILLKEMARKLAEEKGLLDEFALYDFIEKRVPELFKEIRQDDKVISANVDLYSGFVYNALNIPIDLCTPIFAAARISGWCAHRIEEIVAGGRVIRPAYKNVKDQKEYVPLCKR